MFDSVPTRAERVAAVIALVALVLAVGVAALGYGIAAVVSFFVALTCGTIAKARVDLDSLRTFGLRRVDEDDPDARRYRERRRREAERIEGAVGDLEYDPRLDRSLAVVLAIVGIGALALVATTDEYTRRTGRLLGIALIALNCSLIAYAASYVDSSDE